MILEYISSSFFNGARDGERDYEEEIKQLSKKKKKRRNQTKQERFYLKENAFRVFVLLWGMVKQSFREA